MFTLANECDTTGYRPGWAIRTSKTPPPPADTRGGLHVPLEPRQILVDPGAVEEGSYDVEVRVEVRSGVDHPERTVWPGIACSGCATYCPA